MAEAVKKRSRSKAKGYSSGQRHIPASLDLKNKLSEIKFEDSNVQIESVPKVQKTSVPTDSEEYMQSKEEHIDKSIKTRTANAISQFGDAASKIEVINTVATIEKENETLEKQQSCGINDSTTIVSARLQTPSAPPSASLASSSVEYYREISSYRALQELIESRPSQAERSNLYPLLPPSFAEYTMGSIVQPYFTDNSHVVRTTCVNNIYPDLCNERTPVEMPVEPHDTCRDILSKSNEIRPLPREQLMNLYNNTELKKNDMYISSFIHNELSVEDHELYQLISKYQKAREECLLSEECIVELQNKYKGKKDNIWEEIPVIKTEKSVCLDKKTVELSEPYVKRTYNESVHKEIKDILERTYKEIEEHYCLHLHTRETTKRLIEDYLNFVLSAPVFKGIAETAPVTGYVQRECRQSDQQDILQLKRCISVLFCFQRHLTKDEQFLQETRNWLTSLVALLLRVATFDDHLFILNHILRCPTHVGNWAACYIQSPTLPSWENEKNNPSLQSCLLDHTVTVLATLLLPVRSREAFLQHCKASVTLATGCDNPQDSHWVFVDSDNEEDLEPFDIWLRWEETDVVSFFTQIPFGNMFCFLLEIESSNGEEKYVPEKYEYKSSEMLKLFSIATHLIYIFHKGFITFQSGKYRQLTKFITRYISDSVKYICEHWESVKKINKFDSPFMKRLEVEFDEFIFRAVSCIASAPRKEAWQFLIFPYRGVSNGMMWKLAWALFNFDEDQQRNSFPVNELIANLQDEKMKNHFQEKIDRLEFKESFYLLSALVEMVNSRETDEHQFVCTVTKIIFEVAFTALSIREKLSKDGRDMLRSIVEKHPYVVSNILKELKIKIRDIGKASIYLFKELPLQSWKPSHEDVDIISNWLCSDDFPLNSFTNQLARLIISNINWGKNEDGTALMVDSTMHYKVALSIVEAYGKFIKVQDRSYIVWAYEQLAWVASAMKSAITTATATDEEGFAKWAWEMLLILRLHCLDEVTPPYEEILKGCVIRDEVPSILHTGVKDVTLNSAACYVAILLTPFGHQSDLISTEGSNLLLKLIENKQYVAAVSVLPYIMPFFYKNPTGLLKNQKFNKSIQLLLTADIDDMTYLQKVKTIVSSESLGKVLPIIASTIKFQVEQAVNMNASSDAVKLWIKILFEILISAIKHGILETWKGSNQVYYLLDEITRIAFVDPDMRDVIMMEIKNIEKFLYIPTQEGNSLIDAIVQLIPRAQKASLLSDFVPLKYQWFSWSTINVELDCNNVRNIWKQVLTELAVQPSISISDALKKVTSSLKIKFPMSSLPIYKWSMLTMKTPVTHQLYPLICQQFFIYYFYRVPSSHGLTGVGSLGRKFFENSTLKEIRMLLESARDENYKVSVAYEAELSSAAKNKIPVDKQEILTSKKEFHEKLMKLFAAFTVWLDEPRLHDPSLSVYNLPSNYLPDRLSCIFSLDMEPWYLLVDMEKLQEDLDEQLNAWHCYKKSSDSFSYSEAHRTKSSQQKILKRLNSYKRPKPPPSVRQIKPPFERVREEMFCSFDAVKGIIERELQVLRENIDEFLKRMSTIRELDETYHKCIMGLYTDNEKKVSHKVPCNRGDEDTPGGCSGAAIIFMIIEEKVKDKKVSQEIDHNRVAYHISMTELREPLKQPFYCAAARVSVCLKTLLQLTQNAEKCHNIEKYNDLRQIGISLFYYFMDSFDDKIDNFQPTKNFFSEQLHFLLKEFIRDENQNVAFLQKLTVHQHVSSLLPVLDLFNPMASNGDNFVELYECVIDLMKNTKLPQNVTLTLVGKFNISMWLQKRKFSSRSLLIRALGRALCNIGQDLSEKRDIFNVYDQHLGILLIYEFPEHYSEILNMLLNATDTILLPKEAWTRFMHSLGFIMPSDLATDNRGILQEYARKQQLFSPVQVRDTLKLIANHFSVEAENFNLYEKYKYYVPSISNILAVMSHIFVHSVLSDFTQYENEMILKVWEILKETFGPWIHPTQNKSPWSPNNTDIATIMFRSYVMCIEYLEKRVNEFIHSTTILPIIWRYYVDTFSHSFVKEHVRVAAQEHLYTLKWNEFSPNLEDLQMMIQVVDEQVHSNVNFVSSLFVRIPWTNINSLSGSKHDGSNSEVLPVLTTLIMKLAWEPTVVEAGTLPKILRSVETCHWHLINEKTLVQVVEAFIGKCNPECILEEKQTGSMEAVLLRFLRITTGMERLELLQKYPDTLQHRLLYVKTFMRLLIQCSFTQPALLKEKKNLFLKAVHNILHQIELSSQHNVALSYRFKQTVEMISKFLVILSEAPQTELRDLVMEGLITWFEQNTSTNLLLPCIQASCRSVTCVQYLVEIIECCLSKHFIKSHETTHILRYLAIPESQEEDFIVACSKENLHLCQYMYVEQKLLEGKHWEDIHLLNMLVNCNEEAYPSEHSEQKLILLWDKILAIALKQIEVDESEMKEVKEALEKFSKKLANFGKERKMVIVKAPYRVTTRFRFLARFVASFVLVQIPVHGPVRHAKYAEGHIVYNCAPIPSTKEKTFFDIRCKPSQSAQDSLRQLQDLLKWREYSDIKGIVEEAVNTVMDPNNHLGNARKLLKCFVGKVYRNSPNKFFRLLCE